MDYKYNERQEQYLDNYCIKKWGCKLSDFNAEWSYYDDWFIYSLPETFSEKLRFKADELYPEIEEFLDVIDEFFYDYQKGMPVNDNVGDRPEKLDLPIFTAEYEDLDNQIEELSKLSKVKLCPLRNIYLDDKVPASIRNNVNLAIGQYNIYVEEENERINLHNKNIKNHIQEIKKRQENTGWLGILKEYLHLPYALPNFILEKIDNQVGVQYADWEKHDIQNLIAQFDEFAEICVDMLALEN